MPPRAVLVDRPTAYEELLVRHATRGQVAFFLERRGLDLAEVDAQHARHEAARRTVLGGIPPTWRTATARREELDRFLFTDDDVVVVLGQDGLVANVARWLWGQPVLGLDPEHEHRTTVLTARPPAACADLLADLAGGRGALEERAMVRATLDDGRELRALNEVFVGHRSHQSARYRLRVGELAEHQSSSGVLACTGTGATGWAASIGRERPGVPAPPAPPERGVLWLVREAWPGPGLGVGLTAGRIGAGEEVEVRGELGEGGVVFGDGIEQGALELDWGQAARIAPAEHGLRLVR